jgi:ferredoxin
VVKEATLRIVTDETRCCGSGNCVLRAPAVFDQREEDGVVMVIDRTPPVEEHGRVRTAVAGCPTSAIRITDR